MTTLFDQFAPLFELTREMDRMFARGGAIRSYVPAADVVVTDDDVNVYMDVPGLGVDDLEIELVDDVLTIKGERAYPYATGNGNGNTWQRLERGFGKFERVVQVPHGLDPDSIEASIADGVLTLHLPKPEARKPHRVAIKAAAGQPALTEGVAEEQAADQREPAGATA